MSAASDLSASLSAYTSIPEDFFIESTYVKRRVLLTDLDMEITYDSSDINNLVGKTLFTPASASAVLGEQFFESKFSNDSLESCIAVPIMNDGHLSGALLILESDLSFRAFLDSVIFSSLSFSVIIVLVFGALFIFIATLLRRRIIKLLTSIRTSRTDAGNNQIPISRNDEIAPIVKEFNSIYEELNYTQQMRQAFVSDASHELRTPLTAIKLLCESIIGTDNVDIETTREFMDDIILEVDRMSHTAEKLLVLSRLDNASAKQLSPISVSEIVEKMITALTPIAEAKSVSIKTYLEDDCVILGDREGANQIIGNLIDNAIKYNNVAGTLRIYLYNKGDNCVFITDDTGIGIAPEFREHVFERFYRVDKSREHDGRGGSGLGLSIVKRNIESFGGHVEISDSVHGGTRFTVTLPRFIAEEGEF